MSASGHSRPMAVEALRAASITLPGSPVSLSVGDEAPHIFTRRSRLKPGEFLITSAKGLLQHNLPIAARCAAPLRYPVAMPYSITSSAATSSVCGTVRPSALGPKEKTRAACGVAPGPFTPRPPVWRPRRRQPRPGLRPRGSSLIFDHPARSLPPVPEPKIATNNRSPCAAARPQPSAASAESA
jgi:hypothetical protein